MLYKGFFPVNGSSGRNGVRRSHVYFSRTSGVPMPEYEAIYIGVQRMVSETGKDITPVDLGGHYISDFPNTPDSYQELALTRRKNGCGRQVDVTLVNSFLKRQCSQERVPRFGVTVLDKDLTADNDGVRYNVMLGFNSYPNIIISVARFIESIEDPQLRTVCLSISGAHQFGHTLGGPNAVYHCNGDRGPCVMEPVTLFDAKPIDKQAKLLFDREIWLCSDCNDEIQSR